jgi:hypothetical protein
MPLPVPDAVLVLDESVLPEPCAGGDVIVPSPLVAGAEAE